MNTAGIILTLMFIVLPLTACQPSNEGKYMSLTSGQHAQRFELPATVTVSGQYLLYLPEGYAQGGKSWPMILFLHGAGERGDDLEKVKIHGPPKIVDKQKPLPFIIVSPQCPDSSWWGKPVEVSKLKALLDDIIDKYPVDTSRIYLTGLSMGGFGTWSLACAYPGYFAAAAPICGAGPPENDYRVELKDKACIFKDVPVWAFHGAKDLTVSVKESEDMVNAINACRGNARLTVYPGAGHDSWTQAYDNPRLYEWFLLHRKK